MSEQAQKKENTPKEIEGPFSKVVIHIKYDEVERRDSCAITLYVGESRERLILIGTRVSPLDGATLMVAYDSKDGEF